MHSISPPPPPPFISPDNVRPRLLPALLENPSISEGQIVKLALSALRETIEVMLKSKRVHSMSGVIEALKSNPYLKPEEAAELRRLSGPVVETVPVEGSTPATTKEADPAVEAAEVHAPSEPTGEGDDEHVSSYLKEHEHDIAAEGDKPFQAIGGIVDTLGDAEEPAAPATPTPAVAAPDLPLRRRSPRNPPSARMRCRRSTTST